MRTSGTLALALALATMLFIRCLADSGEAPQPDAGIGSGTSGVGPAIGASAVARSLTLRTAPTFFTHAARFRGSCRPYCPVAGQRQPHGPSWAGQRHGDGRRAR